jgi:histidine triad (HIT) family protein
MENCVFCSIIDKSLPCNLVYEDEEFIVIRDIHPLTPLHLLVIPRRHFSSINDLDESDPAYAGRMLFLARKIARERVGSDGGYRLVINTGAEGGQSVFHLHMHILSGKPLISSLLTRGLR